MTKPVIIAGAGPGGLAAALALHEKGIPVQIFESVAELRPLGVGINLLPHAVRMLYTWGLGDALDTIAIRTAELAYYNKFGQLIWSEQRGLDAGYAFPQYSIHRGRLQMLLFSATQARLGEGNLHTDHTLTGWEEEADGVTVRFQHRDGTSMKVSGSCLIAADGIHSAARYQLYPDEGTPIYSGRILWRAVSEADPFLTGQSMIMAGHQDQKFVCYPISPEHASRGKALINWVAELNVPDWQAPKQDWNRQVDKSRFAEPFQSWNFDWLDVPALIDSTEAIYEYPLVDRNPLPAWTKGRVTLLGDAAHPMYPIGSNGASQAILDAEALANELAAHSDIHEALLAYEEARRPATSRIVLMNRQNGPEQVMQLAEERAPNGFKQVTDVISQQELEEIANRYKQTAGFAVAQVNKTTLP